MSKSSAKPATKNRKRSQPKKNIDARRSKPATRSIDSELLVLLQSDCRQSNLALAESVGLSPAACHERVKKLLANGAVDSFGAQLNPIYFNVAQVIFIGLDIDRTVPAVIDRLRASALANAQIQECHLTAGPHDAMLKLRVRDLADYKELMDRAIWSIPGIRAASTTTSIDILKETNKLALT